MDGRPDPFKLKSFDKGFKANPTTGESISLIALNGFPVFLPEYIQPNNK